MQQLHRVDDKRRKRSRKARHKKSTKHTIQAKHNVQSSPTRSSAKRVLWLLFFLVISFYTQNVILSGLKNTSLIRSPVILITLNLFLCITIFVICVALTKHPQHAYVNAHANTNNMLLLGDENRERRGKTKRGGGMMLCFKSSSAFCCCPYLCFQGHMSSNSNVDGTNHSDHSQISFRQMPKDDAAPSIIPSTTSVHDFRKTFLMPMAPWLHAMAIFLNVR